MRRILIVDDDPVILTTLAEAFERANYLVIGSEGDWASAIADLHEQPVDVVVTDIAMEGMDGLEALEVLHRDFPRIPVIAISGAPQFRALLAKASEMGAIAVFKKPLDIAGLVDSVDTVLGGPQEPSKGDA